MYQEIKDLIDELSRKAQIEISLENVVKEMADELKEILEERR